jgi:hypothetical protein
MSLFSSSSRFYLNCLCVPRFLLLTMECEKGQKVGASPIEVLNKTISLNIRFNLIKQSPTVIIFYKKFVKRL